MKNNKLTNHLAPNINWSNLPFGYYKTDYNIRCYYKNGKWGDLEVSDSEYINLHMASTCLHYGQESFEGLKAYRGKDDNIRLFRWKENAKRMQVSAKGIMMPEVPQDIFEEAIIKAVNLNKHYVPPYNSGATLYIRPLLIGITAEIGVKPSDEYLFMVFVSPEGPYFKEGFKPADYIIFREFDRAAPLGTGNLKVGGNYAASLLSLTKASSMGYNSVIYLDPKEKKYIDECGPSNFFAIKGDTYITPESASILPSVTNKSLMQMASHMGMKVEKRKVHVDELETFDEVGGCGTAAVISPIGKIIDPDNNKTYVFSKDGKPGPVSEKLYRKLTAIQFGDEEDIFGWIDIV
jgi:branched-chain amino acid aminotransferase